MIWREQGTFQNYPEMGLGFPLAVAKIDGAIDRIQRPCQISDVLCVVVPTSFFCVEKNACVV